MCLRTFFIHIHAIQNITHKQHSIRNLTPNVVSYFCVKYNDESSTSMPKSIWSDLPVTDSTHHYDVCRNHSPINMVSSYKRKLFQRVMEKLCNPQKKKKNCSKTNKKRIAFKLNLNNHDFEYETKSGTTQVLSN